MEFLPVELVRYVGSVFLREKDRLVLAQVNCIAREACGCDVDHILSDDIDVCDKRGFQRSPNGYWHASDPPPGINPHPIELGYLAATAPYSFLRSWLHVPLCIKTRDFRRQCIESLSLHVWHEEVLLSIKVLRSHRPRSPDKQLLRRALWYCRTEVVCHLLDGSNMSVDASDGAALSLALSTLGHDRPEGQVADLVLQLLIRGANPTRHNFWSLRVSLHLNYYVVAGLLCAYAMKVAGGESGLVALVNEYENRDLSQHADIIRASAGFFYLV